LLRGREHGSYDEPTRLHPEILHTKRGFGGLGESSNRNLGFVHLFRSESPHNETDDILLRYVLGQGTSACLAYSDGSLLKNCKRGTAQTCCAITVQALSTRFQTATARISPARVVITLSHSTHTEALSLRLHRIWKSIARISLAFRIVGQVGGNWGRRDGESRLAPPPRPMSQYGQHSHAGHKPRQYGFDREAGDSP
jgi:hypothetical protein